MSHDPHLDASRISDLAALLRLSWDAFSANIHTAMPGEIIDFNDEECSATVQPHQMRRFSGQDEPVKLPPISKVPIQFPRTQNAWIRFPLSPGDKVTVIFASRSLDGWLQGDGTPVYDDDHRRFALTDAIAIPGIYPFAQGIKPKGAKSSVELAYKDTYLELTRDGKAKIATANGRFEMTPEGTLSIGNSDSELVSLVALLFDTLTQAKMQTALGPQLFLADTLKALEEGLAKAKRLQKQ